MVVAIATTFLGGCLDNGSPADPPSSITATAGDGRVVVTWTGSPGVDYWLFSATHPSLTAFNWTNLPNARVYFKVASPYYLCGLLSDTAYYFAMNGRTGGGPGGPSSPTTPAATTYDAITKGWTLNSASLIQNIYGVGYTSLTTCTNTPLSATGSFAAVGAGGAIFTSPDGIDWTAPATPPPGFMSDLNAVTGYTANLNNTSSPGLRWVAVGAGGASVYSTDGSTWSVGTATSTTQALRSITQVTGTFFAVGDAGTIISSTNGDIWTSHTTTSGTTNNLNGVTHGNKFIAVGDNGTIVVSSDGNTWVTPASWAPVLPYPALKKVIYFGNIIVAVGDSGTVVTSKDNGATWTEQILAGSPNLVDVTAKFHLDAIPVVDPELNYISTALFAAVDSAGNTYASPNGITWTNPSSTGISPTNALVSSGFGYVAAGNAGATAYAF